jgi:hypothetical protein
MSGVIPQRVKGQEVQILYVAGGTLQETLTDTVSFEFGPKLELKEQGYLGETTNRHDDIYNGVKFTGKLHCHTQDWFSMQTSIIQRARRQVPSITFNISAVLDFPNGNTPSVLLSDCYFGPQTQQVGGRGEYVTINIEGGADDQNITTS